MDLPTDIAAAIRIATDRALRVEKLERGQRDVANELAEVREALTTLTAETRRTATILAETETRSSIELRMLREQQERLAAGRNIAEEEGVQRWARLRPVVHGIAAAVAGAIATLLATAAR